MKLYQALGDLYHDQGKNFPSSCLCESEEFVGAQLHQEGLSQLEPPIFQAYSQNNKNKRFKVACTTHSKS